MKRVAEESRGVRQMAATILVMDDDECMRQLLRLHLSNAGYKVLVAEDVVVVELSAKLPLSRIAIALTQRKSSAVDRFTELRARLGVS